MASLVHAGRNVEASLPVVDVVELNTDLHDGFKADVGYLNVSETLSLSTSLV